MKRIVPLVFVVVALLTPLIAPMTFGRPGASLGVIAQEMQDRDGDSIPDSEDACPDDPADGCQVETVVEASADGNESQRTIANTSVGDSQSGSQSHLAPSSNVAQGQISGQAVKAPKPSKTPVPTKTLAPTKTPVPTKTPRPTKTVVPSRTPVPTRTLIPTRTPTEVPTIAPTQTATLVPTVIPSVTPTEIPTETPTEVPTETPTEVPTETVEPTPTPFVDVVTGNLIPSSGPQLEGAITLDASGSSSCGYPLTYWWSCYGLHACSAFLTATSSGNVSTYQFPILDGQWVYITLWVCSVGPTGGCTPPIYRDYDGVWLG